MIPNPEEALSLAQPPDPTTRKAAPAGDGHSYDARNIQVLKGPQGTLFGLSADAGAILYEPRRPGNRFGDYAEVAVGAIVRLTPPFGRELDAEVNGAWKDEIDGSRRIGVKLLDQDGWFAD